MTALVHSCIELQHDTNMSPSIAAPLQCQHMRPCLLLLDSIMSFPL
jgi:hypothetical protein